MNIRFKKLHEDAVIPKRANETDAGYDIVTIDDGESKRDENGKLLYIQYRTGLAIQPPAGYHTEIIPRSSITKTHYILANSIGIIDEGYRGELLIRFKNSSSNSLMFSSVSSYKKGDKIAQLLIRKTISANFVEVEELTDTERGDGGFGSSGS